MLKRSFGQKVVRSKSTALSKSLVEAFAFWKQVFFAVQKELQVKMEKKEKNTQLKKGRRKLPTISQNKSQLSLQPKLPELMTSPSHVNDLRKLFYQYKSNAKILTCSPYYTNRQQNHELVSIIQANKHQPSADQLTHITQKFVLSAEAEQQIANLPFMHYAIKLHVFAIALDLVLKARNVQELQLQLKRQFAVQQLKSNGASKQMHHLGGFESNRQNYHLDYTLANKTSILPSGKYDLKPWFLETVKGNVGLKDFRIIRCLGTGGFSLVYLARDKWKGDFYALKLMDKSFILESQRQTIVQNQRYVLGELKNPFVTAFKFCFQTKNHFVFAIQYCPGGELFYQLKKVKRMSEEEARFYFLEILIGLDYIHKKGIIYRDLKPENLLIGADGHIRIADFGLAKPLLGRESAFSFCGSPQYMAPQMLLKSGHNATLDYYCLGTLLYELVFGLPPFYSLNHSQIYDGILNEELSFPNNITISSQLNSLLLSLLQKNPKKRLGCLYGVKQILLHPWIGRIKAKDIQEKKLQPPFMPNLKNFNFDESELAEKSKEMQKKIQEDLLCKKFEAQFNSDFYFADSTLLPSVLKRDQSAKQIVCKSLEKKRITRSLIKRIETQRGKSK